MPSRTDYKLLIMDRAKQALIRAAELHEWHRNDRLMVEKMVRIAAEIERNVRLSPYYNNPNHPEEEDDDRFIPRE